MAEVVLSASERNQIDSVVRELRSTIDDFFGDSRAALSNDEWSILVDYAAACVRRVLEIGTSLHAVVAANEGLSQAYAGRGGDVFVRAALGAWSDAYAPIKDVWRLIPVFEKISGGEKRVLADVATLETMAANRLFTSLDEQCAKLFPTEA